MGDRFEKVKNHVKEHQTAYCCAATGVVVAGITVIIMRGMRLAILGVTNGPLVVTAQPLSFFPKQTNNIVTTINRNNSGPPSYIVECLETKEAWLSQRQACIAKDIPVSKLSAHLNGKFEDADGLHFRRVGVATA